MQQQLVAFYGCILAGCVPVLVPSSSNKVELMSLLPTLVTAWNSVRPHLVLTSEKILKLLKSSSEKANIKSGSWPQLVTMESFTSKEQLDLDDSLSPEDIALSSYTVSPAGVLAGLEVFNACVSLAQVRTVHSCTTSLPSRQSAG